MLRRLAPALLLLLLSAPRALGYALNRTLSTDLQTRDALPRLVFAHFMVRCAQGQSKEFGLMRGQIGIVSDRTSAADYDLDMQRAKAYGIDAFALSACGLLPRGGPS
jgi:hypothetical protein